MTKYENLMDEPMDTIAEEMLELFQSFLNILDIIEPRHPRQLWSKKGNLLTFLSYSFSLVRWKRVILSLQPWLNDTLDFLESFHFLILQKLLVSLDYQCNYRDSYFMVMLLTVM